MDGDVTARTLRLLTLLQAQPSWEPAVLAERLGTSGRTLRRDLQRLKDLGYGVESRPGPGGHYRLGAGSRLPPMVFDDDEVVALVAGLRMAHQGLGGEAASRALVKLRQVLPRRLATLAGEVAEHSETVTWPGWGDEADDVLGPLTAAAAADLAVTFAYLDRHGTASRRHVDSLRCLYSRGRWYLLAHDLGRADWRVFRLDRVADVVADAGPSPRRAPPYDDLTRWLATDFGRLDAPPERRP